MNVLFIRTDYDLVTKYTSSWLQDSEIQAQMSGHQIADLNNPSANDIYNFISMNNPDALVQDSHGCPYIITTTNQEFVWWTIGGCNSYYHDNINTQPLAGKLVYFLSCLTGKHLIPDMVSQTNVNLAVGYKEDFCFIVDGRENPKTDIYAGSFRDSSNAIIRAILEGRGAKEVLDMGVNEFNNQIELWKVSSDPMASEVRTWLYWDRDALISAGREGEFTPSPGVVRAGFSSWFMGLLFIGFLYSLYKNWKGKL